MRLTEFEKISIIDEAIKCYDENVSVILFGSRVNDSKKGGDIDLLIIPSIYPDDSILFDKKIKFLESLKDRIGDQKIDVVIKKIYDSRNIINTALETGLNLC